ncbi:MAG TPA: hypothetical protein VIY08_10290 [Candidatus Nitrosocosmicus sp.]
MLLVITSKKRQPGTTTTTVMIHIAIQELFDNDRQMYEKDLIIQRILGVWSLPVHLDLNK